MFSLKLSLSLRDNKELRRFVGSSLRSANSLSLLKSNHIPIVFVPSDSHLVVLDLHAGLLTLKVSLGNDSPLHGVGDDEHGDQDQHRDGDRHEDDHQHGDLLCVGLLASIGHD